MRDQRRPEGGKRLIVAVKPPKPMQEMTPEERLAFFGTIFDRATDAVKPTVRGSGRDLRRQPRAGSASSARRP